MNEKNTVYSIFILPHSDSGISDPTRSQSENGILTDHTKHTWLEPDRVSLVMTLLV